ncbi:MAG: biotin transporter BioY [Mogibacterium sp.]|nr:biotin transporter BioY [Mogibacterium sp.]
MTLNTTGENTLNNRLKAKDYALIGQFAALIALCSWITIPSVVPFTMQTFAVFLTVGLLGGRRGSLTVVIYLLLGAIGLPVFSGFSGGIGYMMGPTGGYMIGFIASALLMWAMERFLGGSQPVLISSMVLGLLACYAFGTAWFVIVYTKNTGAIGLGTALGWCVFPYIIPDALKIALSAFLCRRLKRFVY